MAFKDKTWIFCLIGAIVVIIGYFVPYAFYIFMGFTINFWLFGFVSGAGSGYMVPWVGDMLLLGMLGIIIVVLAVVALIISILMKSREGKVMKILVIIFGAVILILGILPPMISYLFLAFTLGIGYYLILIGSILLILFGILGMVLK
ncbi:MAG: hypothetical protein ACFFAN_18580 [Promethearchaeota archaeon]